MGILLDANITLAEVYKLKGITDSTLKYMELRDFLKDSIFSQEKQKEIQKPLAQHLCFSRVFSGSIVQFSTLRRGWKVGEDWRRRWGKHPIWVRAIQYMAPYVHMLSCPPVVVWFTRS